MSTRPTCALVLLCVVRGCERFAFFAMLPLFVLYLHHRHGFSEPSAILLFGVFHALSYVGGIACRRPDRSQARATGRAALIGCGLMTLAGYGALALDLSALFWPALGLMVIGHSFSNQHRRAIRCAVPKPLDARRGEGFFLQHLAVNIAAMAGPLCGEWLRAGLAATVFWSGGGDVHRHCNVGRRRNITKTVAAVG